MKIYRPAARGKQTAFVSPGAHHPETSDWMDANTGKPRMFTVEFVHGVAKVDRQLGEYMIERQLAQRSPIILPPTGVIHV